MVMSFDIALSRVGLHLGRPDAAGKRSGMAGVARLSTGGCGTPSATGAWMILGIGTDLANIERIAGVLDRFGDRFRTRVFTEAERRKAERRRDTAATYAKRWAAKEACSKALGTGLRMGIAWKDMAVRNLATGQPVMELTGWAAARLAELTPPGHTAVVHVSLTDDHPWAQAVVVIEARPVPPAEADSGAPSA
jgi:holo-[acyl-carrier protein] synthase